MQRDDIVRGVKRSFLAIVIILGIIGFSAFMFRNMIVREFFRPLDTEVQQGISITSLQEGAEDGLSFSISQSEDVMVIAEDLIIPWEIVFLPNGEMLVTERSGKLIKLGDNKQVIQEIEGVEHVGEGGLMGMALHPEFEQNRLLYLYLTTRSDSGLINRVERYKFDGNSLSNKETILDNIPGARFHDGGRIAFGPDEKLYITTGDAGVEASSQEINSLSGKILRLNDDGSIPEDNPFENEVWAYGLRNPQGITWDDEGGLWSTDHGPSGTQTGYDELNLIVKGGNYGWPIVRGEQIADRMIPPVVQSGSRDTWAPAAAVYYNGSIFFAGLRGSSLYEAKLDGDKVTDFIAHFRNDYGRLRAVTLSPDGLIIFSTSNTDGRGTTRENDDKLISVRPEIFFND